MYRAPRPEQTFTLKWLDSIDNSLQLAYSENKHIAIMGDVNIDLWKPHPLATKWLEMCSAFGLVQIITEPARVCQNLQKVLLITCAFQNMLQRSTIKWLNTVKVTTSPFWLNWI